MHVLRIGGVAVAVGLASYLLWPRQAPTTKVEAEAKPAPAAQIVPAPASYPDPVAARVNHVRVPRISVSRKMRLVVPKGDDDSAMRAQSMVEEYRRFVTTYELTQEQELAMNEILADIQDELADGKRARDEQAVAPISAKEAAASGADAMKKRYAQLANMQQNDRERLQEEMDQRVRAVLNDEQLEGWKDHTLTSTITMLEDTAPMFARAD